MKKIEYAFDENESALILSLRKQDLALDDLCRKHRRWGGKTPYEACLAWFAKQPDLFIKEPAALLAFRSQSRET